MEGIIISPNFHIEFQSIIGTLIIKDVKIERRDFEFFGSPIIEYIMKYPNEEYTSIRIAEPLRRIEKYISNNDIKHCVLEKATIINTNGMRKINFEYIFNHRQHKTSGEYDLVTLSNDDLKAYIEDFDF